ncbi:MAG: peptidoglycan-binding protein [Nanoarchaeota archaeon]|nr:peptidoglycan-binding protein [Nanoarchaeota archaeon]MBU1644043.1 peptidoglycan-binding protein [Nanoarchaeota archaeon]MBU1977285.1 peptidoglycan-binding protein [Nanoarchaeota archaeon]
MKKVVFILVITILLASLASAENFCSVTSSCSEEESAVLYLNQKNNAHGYTTSGPVTNQVLCCYGEKVNNCIDDKAQLWLNQNNNAHAGKSKSGLYNVSICIPGNPPCTWANKAPTGYEESDFVIGLNQNYNAHLYGDGYNGAGAVNLYCKSEICTNKKDDNNDGLIDCLDPTCNGKTGQTFSSQLLNQMIIQQALANAGYNPGPINGIIEGNSLTVSAIKEFQKNNDLTVNGIVDFNTYEKLMPYYYNIEPFKPLSAGICEYQEELTCNDGFDNDGDDIINIVQICSPGSIVSCVGNNVKKCNSAGSGYDIIICAENTLCINGECKSLSLESSQIEESASNVQKPSIQQIQEIPQQPLFGQAIQPPTEPNEEKQEQQTSLWQKFLQFLWGNKEARAGLASEQPSQSEQQTPSPPIVQYTTVCGNNNCETGENFFTCPKDCPIKGTDCKDSDCLNSIGPGGAKCCLGDSCGSGASCQPNHECKETDCNTNSGDEDGDGLANCADPDCNNQLCGGTQGSPKICYVGNCTGIPEAPKATIPKPAVIEKFSYKEVLKILNKCEVVKSSGMGNTVCQAQGKTCVPFANDCTKEGNKFTCC